MGILLAIIALILLVVVFIIESIFSFFFQIKGRKWFQLVSYKMYIKAKLIDIFSNYLFPEFWNYIFSKIGQNYKFGKLGETLSSVFGKKRIEESLSLIGLAIYYVLYFIDIPSWKYGVHCIRWIMTEEEIQNFKK